MINRKQGWYDGLGFQENNGRTGDVVCDDWSERPFVWQVVDAPLVCRDDGQGTTGKEESKDRVR